MSNDPERKKIEITEEKMNEVMEKFANDKVKEAFDTYKDELKSAITEDIQKEMEQKSRGSMSGEVKESEVNELSVKFFGALAKKDHEKALEVQKELHSITKAPDDELVIGTDSLGGYYVPKPIMARIITKVESFGLARKYGFVVPMTKDKMGVPRVDTEAELALINEKAQYGALNYEFGNTNLDSAKYGGLVKPSKEFIADANVGVIDLLFTLFARAQARTEDSLFLNGILADASVTSYTMGSGDTDFVDMILDDAMLMQDELDDGDEENQRYVFHKNIISHLKRIKVDTTTDNRYVFGNPGGESPKTLWDMPYHTNSKMPSIADTAVDTPFGIFGNLQNYMLGDRQQMTMQVLTERFADYGQVGIVVDTRLAVGGAIPSQIVKIKTAAA